MLVRLALLFIGLPFVELILLIKLAQWTDLLTTLAIIVLTGVVGLLTARVQGWLVWQKIQLDLRRGVLPADGLIEAVVLLAAGLLLITPGLITDTVGIVLLLPAGRRYVRDWIKRKFREMIRTGRSRVFVVHGETLDVEDVEEEDPTDKRD